MEFNPNLEQLLRDQQAIILHFGKEMHGKDKTGYSREERDLTKDKDEEKDEEKDETIDTNEHRCD